MWRRVCLALLVAAACAGRGGAAIPDGVVKIVVLNDQASAYSDTSGRGSAVAARLAIEDFGGLPSGARVELLTADHQLKPDVGVAVAKRMIEVEKADAFFDIANSGVSLALQGIMRDADKVIVHVGSGSSDLFGKACSPTGALWLYDSNALAKGLAGALYDDAHRRWFLLTADYAFGHSMETEMANVVRARGGEVTGAVRHPLATSDFSSYLLQAGAGTQVLALLNAGADTTNAVKQIGEFGLARKGVKLAVPIFTIVNARALGPDAIQGITFLAAYYWDRDDASRAFAARFAAVMKRPPTHAQAAVYSAVLHYLKGVAATGSTSGVAVMDKMKEMPVADFMTPNVALRADGRLMRDLLLMEAKPRAEIKGEWDLLRVRAVVPAATTVRPMSDGGCPFVPKARP